MIKWMLLSLCTLALAHPATAQDKRNKKDTDTKDSDKPVMVILLPTVRTQQNAQRNDDQVNPSDLVGRVYPRIVKEADKKKWPFRIVNPESLESVYLSVSSTPRNPEKDTPFGFLKPIADKLEARYLVSFAINELTGYQSKNTLQAMTKARTQIDLYIYDRETNEYVWQRSEKSESGRASAFGAGSIGQRLDQALVNAITRAIEPFAKGERKKIGRPVADVLVSVQKVIADGKKVILNAGKGANLTEGDLFKSVESDCELRVIEVLENASIAEVVSGTPKVDETFKSKK